MTHLGGNSSIQMDRSITTIPYSMTPPRRLKKFKTTTYPTRIPATWKVLLGRSISLLRENPGDLIASLKQKKRDFGIARNGGLQHAEQFLDFEISKTSIPLRILSLCQSIQEYRDKKHPNLAPYLPKNSASQLSISDI